MPQQGDRHRAAHVVAIGTDAAPALRHAIEAPELVLSLTLIAPDVMSLWPDVTKRAIYANALAARQRFRVHLEEGDVYAAMRVAIDAARGEGTWALSTPAFRARMARRAGGLADAWIAQDRAPIAQMALSGIVCPTLVISGTAVSNAAQHDAKALVFAIPFAAERRIPGAGLSPHLTMPHHVMPVMREMLVRTSRWWHDDRAQTLEAA